MELNHYLLLKSNEIHIWIACLSEYEKKLSYFTLLLSKDENERANSFQFFKDFKRFSITRGILKSLLAKYLREAPQAIKIIYGQHGKPFLSRKKYLHFNVSHSGDYAVFAFTKNFEIGIDLEYIDKNFELEGMALSIFSAKELNYWKKLHPEKKVEFFFQVWVGKEAFLKALGKGWLENDENIKFKELYFYEQNLSNETFKNEFGFLNYFQSIPGYVSAFFIKGPNLKPTFFNLK